MPAYVTREELADKLQARDKARREQAERFWAAIGGIEARLSALEAVPEPEPPSKAQMLDWRLAFTTNLLPTSAIDPRNEYVIVQWWHADRIAAVRGFGGKVLVYQNCTRAGEPDSSGGYNSGLTLAQAKALGAATDVYWPPALGYICKPGTQGYPEAWAKAAIARAKSVGADGVFLDDMNVQTSEQPGGYGAGATWHAEMERFNSIAGPMIREAGLLAIPNLSGCVGQADLGTNGWLERQIAHFDGGLDEFFYTWANGAKMADAFIQRALDIATRQTAKGKLWLAHTSNAQGHAPAALAALKAANQGTAAFYTESKGFEYQSWVS